MREYKEEPWEISAFLSEKLTAQYGDEPHAFLRDFHLSG